MIRDFATQETADLFFGRSSRRIPGDVQRRAVAKLVSIHAARSVNELQRIPGNRLEKLKGDRKGLYSIRINNQWRICFRWRGGDAYEVEIADYRR